MHGDDVQALNTALEACQTQDLLPALAGAVGSLKAGKARCALLTWFCCCAGDGSMAVPLPGSDLRWASKVLQLLCDVFILLVALPSCAMPPSCLCRSAEPSPHAS